jgi:hypothetical protein
MTCTQEDVRVRLAGAVANSFRFLVTELGYSACPVVLVDPDDLRGWFADAYFRRERRRVEVSIYGPTLAPGVTIKDFDGPVDCTPHLKHSRMVHLESEVPAAKFAVPRPKWLKKPTLHEAAVASYVRFPPLMWANFEEAIEYLALLLQHSGLAGSVH